MLKKMRRRVILAAMLSFFAVVLTVAAMVNIMNFYDVTKKSDETLMVINEYDRQIPKNDKPEDPPEGRPDNMQPPPQPFMGLDDKEANYMTRFFVVRFDSEGNVVYTSMDYIAAIESSDAESLGRQVLSKSKDHGYIGDYRYLKSTEDENTVVLFLNVSRDLQYMRSLLVMTSVVSAISLAIVFVLVTIFSKRAIKPYANNIKQQKQFITDAGHELKTPLTSISTSIEVIEMEHGEDEWTGNIKAQIERMTKLVSELVTLSKLDEDKPLYNRESFSLSDAAWEIVDVYLPLAKGNEKELTVEIDDNVMLNGEKQAVQQMISVLLDNAIRYSDERGEIKFSVYKKGGRVQLKVYNTCDYSTPPDVSRLFDRFYRPDESRDTKTGGTGVGLSIAKAVMTAHDGNISASCPDGKSMTIKAVF